MASGIIKSSIYSGAGEGYPDHVYIEWSSAPNITNNTSTIAWKCYGGSSYSNEWNYVLAAPITVTINGTTVLNLTTRFEMRKDQLLGSGTLTVSHNSNGKKSVSVNISAALYSYAVSSTYSGSIELDEIPRNSSISFDEFTMDSAGTITINSASSEFRHTISYTFGSISETIATKTAAYKVSWTPQVSKLAGEIPASTRGSGTFTVTTYSGSTVVGSNNYTFYCNLPDTVVPTVGNIVLTPQTYSYLIQNKNKLNISVTECSAGAGSEIMSYSYSGPGISKVTTNATETSDTISTFGTLTYTITVTDTRGRVGIKTATITCYEYSAPSFKSFTAYRSTSGGVADDSGTYITCKYRPTFYSVNGTNKISVVIQYTTGTTTKTVTALSGSTSTTSQSKLLSSIVANSTYTVVATITDNYGGSTSSAKITISGSPRVFNVSSNGTGFAIGKMSEHDEMFECRWNAAFSGDVDISGGATISGNAEVTGDMAVSGALNVGTILYSSTSGTNGTVTLSETIANFNYLEFFYIDNYSRQPNSTKIYLTSSNKSNGAYVTLSCIEPSTSTGTPIANIRASGWTVSGTSVTPGRSDLNGTNSGVYAQVRNHKDTTAAQCQTTVVENNYIKILRIVGYK